MNKSNDITAPYEGWAQGKSKTMPTIFFQLTVHVHEQFLFKKLLFGNEAFQNKAFWKTPFYMFSISKVGSKF